MVEVTAIRTSGIFTDVEWIVIYERFDTRPSDEPFTKKDYEDALKRVAKKSLEYWLRISPPGAS